MAKIEGAQTARAPLKPRSTSPRAQPETQDPNRTQWGARGAAVLPSNQGRARQRPGEYAGAPARTLRSIDVRDAALTLFAERGYHATSMKDIAAALRLQAPSLYNHVSAKQEILRDVMLETMTELMKLVRSILASTEDTITKLRRAAEGHVRYHARHRREVRVGNHEIAALEEPHRSTITGIRREYSDMFVGLIDRGVAEGVFETRSPMLAAYAILQMGIGVSMWYRAGGDLSEDDIVFQYGDIALGVVRARARAPGRPPSGKSNKTKPKPRRAVRPVTTKTLAGTSGGKKQSARSKKTSYR